jgi:Holliday junction DNA helicase RuvA
MFNSLKGTFVGKTAGKIFLDIGGIEWELDVSYTTASLLPPPGSTIRLFTFLHHREDAMRLYGFHNEEERALFLDLIKVDGIGPKQALRILSGTNVDSFIAILEAGDVDALRRIPGLGVKTAQKIILALKGRLSLRDDAEPTEGEEIIAALADMGFDRKRAVVSVKSLLAELKEEGLAEDNLVKEVFRRAIIRLSG